MDKQCVKMILEHAQMLSTAIRIHSNDSIEGIYKTAHLNHTCTIWTRHNRSNFLWLCEMTEELFKEYTNRYQKIHKSYSNFESCRDNAKFIPDRPLTPFAQTMPDQYKEADAVNAYRAYYIGEKKAFAKSKAGNTPHWWK